MPFTFTCLAPDTRPLDPITRPFSCPLQTTFLSVLRGVAGSTGRQRGRVLVNGREMRLSALRSITGFVPQEVGRMRGAG